MAICDNAGGVYDHCCHVGMVRPIPAIENIIQSPTFTHQINHVMNSKIKMLLLAGVCSISLLSCKKDYDCDCTIAIDLGTGTPFNLQQTTKIEKTTKKGAEGTCDNIKSNLSSTIGLAGGTVTCKIN